MENRWYSITEMTEYLGIKKDTLYKWIKRKDIPVHKVGKLWKFRLEEVDSWIKEGKAADKRKKDAI
ncbi:MAG: helix-turn-helix domain-containing protein [Spirochaetales bacterium]|nr:helix-turn-helix domain-containing protein [Spirochaetales bacterium]